MHAGTILDALKNGASEWNGVNLLFTEAKSREKWAEIKNSSYYANMLAQVSHAAGEYLEQPIQVLPYSLFRIFDDTGSRVEYEKEYFGRRGRLNAFTIMTLVDGSSRYIRALEDILWAICDEYTWCLPAHMQLSSSINRRNPGFSDNRGKVKETAREHAGNIDLFSAETGFALAEILHLLEDRLAAPVVYRVRSEIRRRILEPFCELNASFGWEGVKNNWSAVCAGSVGAAALYMVEDDNVLVPILLRVLGAMECFLDGYEEDGACTEGLGYWNYGFGFYVYFSALLKQRTGGKLDLLSGEKLRRIALFQQRCYMSEDYVLSFSDGATRAKYRIGLTHYLKNVFPEIQMPDRAYCADFHDDNCYRCAHTIRDFVWSSEACESSITESSFCYLENAQWMISKAADDKAVRCFAAKGGHNGESHNHNDIGSFLFHVNGDTFLTDLGAGEYTRQYFGPERYSFFCNGSQGHSVPVIDGQFQVSGGAYAAVVLEALEGVEQDIFHLDIAKAYETDKLISAERHFSFEKTGEGRLVLTDSFAFSEPPAGLMERFVTCYEPVMIGEGKLHLYGKNSIMEMIFDTEHYQCRVGTHVFSNHQAENEDVYTIDLSPRLLENRLSFTAVFRVLPSDNRR
jgi:hypothetical protein